MKNKIYRIGVLLAGLISLSALADPNSSGNPKGGDCNGGGKPKVEQSLGGNGWVSSGSQGPAFSGQRSGLRPDMLRARPFATSGNQESIGPKFY